MKCPYCIKHCRFCNRLLVAYKGNFPKKKRGKYGLNNKCKDCIKEYYENNKEYIRECQKKWRENNPDYMKEWYENNKEDRKEYSKQYYENNKQHRNEHMKEWYENNKQHHNEHMKEWYENNKEAKKEYSKQYYENNKEAKKEWQKEYYENNKEYMKEYSKNYRNNNKQTIKEYMKEYYQNNKEAKKKYMKEYHQNNPQATFNTSSRRRSREENQGRGVTTEQWVDMMNFFEWKCAYSGECLGGETKNRSIDHIIPLAKGGLNEPWNCVPMYRPYNSSKQASNIDEWYITQDFYSEERLNKIYEWQEYAYNKYYEEQ